MDDDAFRRILEYFDLSWSGYRRVRKGVKKRLVGHMQDGGHRNVADYLGWLERTPRATQRARELLTVSISRFYRDRPLWEALERSILPGLAYRAETEGARTIRAWSAGCACGEEAYSLRMAWDQAQRRSPAMLPLEVWATDMNPVVLEKARRGVYGPSSVKGLPEVMLHEYFEPEPAGFAIREALKHGIHWTVHDFTADAPPCPQFDLVLLRNNLLTYFERVVTVRTLSRILQTLPVGGFLIVGSQEELPGASAPLSRSPEYRCVFEKA
ncbi:MAG: protein-glutamate O-methyltransferase CheR [Syntrophobacteraceae bacterium]